MPMAFCIREVSLPILPVRSDELRVLHFSDLHLSPFQRSAIDFIRSWASLKPDLVISTGDHISSARSISILEDALAELLKIPGFFVFGSNDYFAPRLKNPLRYLLPDHERRIHGKGLPWRELDSMLTKSGWVNLIDKKVNVSVNGISLELRGTDDAHLELDDYSNIEGNPSDKDFSIGVTHAPYRRLLEDMGQDGLNLILAGHTHGGQIRVPWINGTRSITTNSDLPNWRSRGLTREGRGPWLHVSAGMGHNPWTPIRLFSPREVTLLRLTTL